MPTLAESMAAIREGAKEDRFTYLTILQYHVTSPEVLPVLNEVLEGDVQLTQEIGWDLVQMLLGIEGSETCLETVARLGNPREVIIKVMEALEALDESRQDEAALLAEGHSSSARKEEDVEEKERPPNVPRQFIVLLGMLAILHGRIKTKHPSSFLGSSLAKVYEAYQPTAEMTAAVINLVRSLSGRKRPPLPTRKSSVNVTNLDRDGDQAASSKNAPDPEADAEQEEPSEELLQQKLLRTFVTCVLQRYVNENEMRWSPRLLEKYHPEKQVPGKKTMTQAFNEEEALHQRDGVVGQLVALVRDLGLNKCSRDFVKSIYVNATGMDPLAAFDDLSSPADIPLSPGGAVCLIAYWIFSAEAFGADSPAPEMHIFPDHYTLLDRFLGQQAQTEIVNNPGIADALLAIGLALQHRDLISAPDKGADFMAYHHHLTLIAVFHPDIHVRNSATVLAGTILHSDPDDQNRLEILEDLLENCEFGALKACAVTWLKEEILSAKKLVTSKGSPSAVSDAASNSIFASPDVIDRLQYLLFPDVRAVKDLGVEPLVDYWAQNSTFLLQVANFAWLLFSSLAELVPTGMRGAVDQRFVEPLVEGAEKLLGSDGLPGEEKSEVLFLVDRLKSIPVS